MVRLMSVDDDPQHYLVLVGGHDCHLPLPDLGSILTAVLGNRKLLRKALADQPGRCGYD